MAKVWGLAVPRFRVLALCGVTILAAGACVQSFHPDKTLPSASDSSVASGVVLYEDANYAGRSALITMDIKDLARFNGPCKTEQTTTPPSDVLPLPTTDIFYRWNDCVSSIRIAPGWHAIVFRDDDLGGERLEVATDVPNLQLVPGTCDHRGLNDCITSIRVIAP